jgi:hypothetical protein
LETAGIRYVTELLHLSQAFALIWGRARRQMWQPQRWRRSRASRRTALLMRWLRHQPTQVGHDSEN